jgi:hypothetical protein
LSGAQAPFLNAELSAPELRGFLVSFYQFATIFGIMLSFWIGYGSNNIGGIGKRNRTLHGDSPLSSKAFQPYCLQEGPDGFSFSPR